MFKISIVGPRMCVSSVSAKNAQHVITMAWESGGGYRRVPFGFSARALRPLAFLCVRAEFCLQRCGSAFSGTG